MDNSGNNKTNGDASPNDQTKSQNDNNKKDKLNVVMKVFNILILGLTGLAIYYFVRLCLATGEVNKLSGELDKAKEELGEGLISALKHDNYDRSVVAEGIAVLANKRR